MQKAMNNENKQPENDNTELTSLQHKLQEVEDLTNVLKRLLVRHEVSFNEEGVRHEVEVLERWMESYRRGLTAANKISKTGIEWLSNLRDQLKLAAEERQRLEGEGGSPASKEQAKKTEDLLEAVRRLDKAIPDIEHMFAPTSHEEHAA